MQSGVVKLLPAGVNGTGNALDNIIEGNSLANTLSGLAGNDTLRGSSGNDVLRAVDNLPGNDGAVDRFVFDTPLNAATNVDTIQRANFIQFGAEGVDDEIVLENSVFTNLVNGGGGNLGTLNALQYFEGAGITGNGLLSAVGIYNDTTTGRLYYNATAFGAGDSVLFAVVNNAGVPGGSASLSAEEFTLA